jgi:hypothetical protein
MAIAYRQLKNDKALSSMHSATDYLDVKYESPEEGLCP